MQHYQLVMIGFGNVGRALARLLLRKEADLRRKYGITFSVTGILTGRHGIALAPNGFNLSALLAQYESNRSLDLAQFSIVPPPADAFEFLRRSQADVLFENSPVNYATGQPAVDHLRLALELGMHAITANKGPVVHAYRELTEIARANGRKFYFESTVMDGAPIFSLYRETLPATHLQAFRGVLNSTTNMILTRMEAGDNFDDAVDYCKQIGISETDPSGDIDGWDAAVKVSALATVLMDAPLTPQQVDREGIRGITREKIDLARQEGKRWKLVCEARRQGDAVIGRVYPQTVGMDSPMYGATGTTSIVQFESDTLGLLSVVEADPGPHTTAYGLLADFVNAVR